MPDVGYMLNSTSDFKQVGIAYTLRRSQLLSGLSSSDLQNITEITVIKSLERGEYLFREGDPSRGFYIVQSGAINVHRVSPSGKEQIIHIFRAGESLAEASLAVEAGYPADARAVESSQVFLVQKAGFLQLLKHQPELALRMLAGMALHLRVLIQQIEDLSLKDVEARLANWLVSRCPDQESREPFKIMLPMTKRVLAAELGTISETFSRTLAKFRNENILEVNGKSITVLSPARLTTLLRGNLAG